MRKFSLGLSVAAACAVGIGLNGSPAIAQLNIIPTFGDSINSDANAAAIKNTINQAIAVYGAKYIDPITVNIQFSAVTTGLGTSTTGFYNVSYATFLAALKADSTSADDATATSLLPNSATNPVNGASTINVKSANMRAIGLTGDGTVSGTDGAVGLFDGRIDLNTLLTTPGTSGSSLEYSLFAVVQHEIDEVLGLGSSLADVPLGTIFPQDLYRYDSAGMRNFTTAGDDAYFSIDGTTDIVQFNQGGGGDYGDWHTSGLVQVQDAFATPFTNATLGPSEIRSLDVIGYTLAPAVTATPEFGSVFSLGGLLMAGGAGLWIRRRTSRK